LLKTVLVNIVDNALKASNKKQPVKISGHLLGGDQQGGYRFSVKDYGIGIGEEDIEKLTQAFYMVDKSRSRRSGGSGLGLTLVAEILELFGSALEIESTLGVGTRVSFVLREGVDLISDEIREGGE
jgi:signal transduction histidine kinase